MEGLRIAPWVRLFRDRANDPGYLDCTQCPSRTSLDVRREWQCGFVPPDERKPGIYPLSHEQPIKTSVCPGYLMQHPGVLEAEASYLWFESGQVADRIRARGDEPTALLYDCVDMLHRAYGEARAHDMAEQRRKR